MADSENEVSTDMPLAKARINSARPSPALPTTYPRRRKRMMPRMVRMLGVNTPAKVPSVPVGCFLRFGLVDSDFVIDVKQLFPNAGLRP